MRFHKITTCDVNNGEGVRVTLWVAGCSHHCKGCQNPHTWDFKGGRPFEKEDKEHLFQELAKPYIQGITLSGGDPLDSGKDIIKLVKEIRRTFPDKDIWLYTGYTINEIYFSRNAEILTLIDVLVDGEFKIDQRDTTLAFRGSRNQKIYRFVRH